jgi:hypothetical protein
LSSKPAACGLRFFASGAIFVWETTPNKMKVGNQRGSELPPLKRAEWMIVIFGTIVSMIAVIGVVLGALLLADYIWP